MGNEFYQVVTWVLVILGWVVVHYLTVVRDRQKEIRDLKLKVIQAISEAETMAIEFHTAKGFDSAKAQKITSMIQRISSDMTRPPLASFQNYSSVAKEFRQAITLKNFDASQYLSQQTSSEIVADISYAAEKITRILEIGYDNRYMRAWWQVFRV